VNGINATIEKKMLQEFLKDAGPDVVCLNETKCDAVKLAKKELWKHIPEGYEQHWNFSKAKLGYSGVAIFSKVQPLKVTHDLGISKHD